MLVLLQNEPEGLRTMGRGNSVGLIPATTSCCASAPSAVIGNDEFPQKTREEFSVYHLGGWFFFSPFSISAAPLRVFIRLQDRLWHMSLNELVYRRQCECFNFIVKEPSACVIFLQTYAIQKFTLGKIFQPSGSRLKGRLFLFHLHDRLSPG